MKSISFTKANKSGNILHIETEGCIVNIPINLHDMQGNEVTSIAILKNDEWTLDGTINNRVIKSIKKSNGKDKKNKSK